MPITKIPKESELYFEIKAKYESKIGTVAELAIEYGLNRQYLTEYAKAEKWERGKTKAIYEAKKLVEMEKVLTEPEKIVNRVITKQAQKEGAKKAELILKSENYQIELSNKLADAGMKFIDTFIDALDNIKNGKVVDTEVEGVIIDDNGKPANVIKKTTALRPKDFEKIITMMQAFGILQTTPTVAMQVNNTNNQTQETKIVKEPLSNMFNGILSTVHKEAKVVTETNDAV